MANLKSTTTVGSGLIHVNDLENFNNVNAEVSPILRDDQILVKGTENNLHSEITNIKSDIEGIDTRITEIEENGVANASAVGEFTDADAGTGRGTAEIFNDYDNNKAFGSYSSASGYKTQAGYCGYKVLNYKNSTTTSSILSGISTIDRIEIKNVSSNIKEGTTCVFYCPVAKLSKTIEANKINLKIINAGLVSRTTKVKEITSSGFTQTILLESGIDVSTGSGTCVITRDMLETTEYNDGNTAYSVAVETDSSVNLVLNDSHCNIVLFGDGDQGEIAFGYQTAQGFLNNPVKRDLVYSVGVGSNESQRSNALEVYANGSVLVPNIGYDFSSLSGDSVVTTKFMKGENISITTDDNRSVKLTSYIQSQLEDVNEYIGPLNLDIEDNIKMQLDELRAQISKILSEDFVTESNNKTVFSKLINCYKRTNVTVELTDYLTNNTNGSSYIDAVYTAQPKNKLQNTFKGTIVQGKPPSTVAKALGSNETISADEDSNSRIRAELRFTRVPTPTLTESNNEYTITNSNTTYLPESVAYVDLLGGIHIEGTFYKTLKNMIQNSAHNTIQKLAKAVKTDGYNYTEECFKGILEHQKLEIWSDPTKDINDEKKYVPAGVCVDYVMYFDSAEDFRNYLNISSNANSLPNFVIGLESTTALNQYVQLILRGEQVTQYVNDKQETVTSASTTISATLTLDKKTKNVSEVSSEVPNLNSMFRKMAGIDATGNFEYDVKDSPTKDNPSKKTRLVLRIQLQTTDETLGETINTILKPYLIHSSNNDNMCRDISPEFSPWFDATEINKIYLKSVESVDTTGNTVRTAEVNGSIKIIKTVDGVDGYYENGVFKELGNNDITNEIVNLNYNFSGDNNSSPTFSSFDELGVSRTVDTGKGFYLIVPGKTTSSDISSIVFHSNMPDVYKIGFPSIVSYRK